MAKTRVEVKSERSTASEYVKIINHVREKCQKIDSEIHVNYLEQTDKKAMEAGKAAGIENYIELEHA